MKHEDCCMAMADEKKLHILAISSQARAAQVREIIEWGPIQAVGAGFGSHITILRSLGGRATAIDHQRRYQVQEHHVLQRRLLSLILQTP